MEININITSKRALQLDALRGFAILTMILSGQIPFHVNTLPGWMYHAQVPPPEHKWIPTIPGITWVDLVFPFFLFAMGAAFPLAINRRIEQGIPEWKISLGILERGFLLGFFALYVQAIRPYVISKSPTIEIFSLALLAFLLLFPIYTRFPDNWNKYLKLFLRILGWSGAIILLSLLKYPDGSGFSLFRSDIIIVVLTNMAVLGSLFWLVTRNNWLLRIGILGIMIAIRLSNMPQPLGGWVTELWNFSPVPWIYKLYYLQYLFIVIPGTIAGDIILKWMKSKENISIGNWNKNKIINISLISFFIVIFNLWGLYERFVAETTLISLLVILIIYYLQCI